MPGIVPAIVEAFMQLSTPLSLAVALLLAGCAYQQSHTAETAQRSLVGMTVADLDMCAGLPTKSERINPATEVRSYERNEATNSGVSLTFPVIGGGMNVGNGGYCHATFKLVDGTVTGLSYAGDTSVAGLNDAICAPIVQTCVRQQAEHNGASDTAVASRR
jgi:hypothetical protein